MTQPPLNPPQQEAVNHINGPLLLLSGAGSGKTKVITHRIAHIIEMGVPQYNILAITFTNKAAKEMKERLEKILNGENNVWISTFHSLRVRILRAHIEKLGYDKNFTIYDSSDSQRLLKDCIKELDLSEKMYSPRTVASSISKLKDDLITPEFYHTQAHEIREKTIAKIYTMYQKNLMQNNALDFDDIIVKTLELFRNNEDVLQIYQNRFKYIIVDEYQDTNVAQYTLINLLAKQHQNLCVVGDDDQSIYGWRGANIRNILDFEKDFAGTKVIKLEQNYRSTENILEAANCVIQNNFQRKEKSLWTDKGKGNKVKYVSVGNDIEEASFVAKEIKENHPNYNEIAILYRKNALSRGIEDAFVKANIPYKIFGGIRFYDRKEIKDLMSYLIALHNTRDSIALKRIINVPKRGIGNVTIEKLSSYASENDMTFYDALKDVGNTGIKTKKIDDFVNLIEDLRNFTGSVSELIKQVLEVTKYEDDIDGDPIEQATRLENIGELISKAVEFENNFKGREEEATLSAFLEEVALVADIDSHDENAGYVSLMTVHSSKGLEFGTVFVIGFEEGIFPSLREHVDPKELEEERRLCYVAITRAIDTLYMTSANQRLTNGRILYNSPSRFLKEIPRELMESNAPKQKTTTTTSEKRGISQYAEIKIFNDHLNKESIGKSYKTPMPAPKDVVLDFVVGDTVNQEKYGQGIVKEITPAGKDFEVAIDFDGRVRKFMANFSKITKA